MEKERLKLPTTPEGWAIHLSKLVRAFHDAHGSPRFPIKVGAGPPKDPRIEALLDEIEREA